MLHLRMTGQVFVLADYRPDKHVHAIFDFDGLPVHYRDIRKFGRFTLVDDPRRPSAIDHVGPDMLAVRFAGWHQSIAQRTARSLAQRQGRPAPGYPARRNDFFELHQFPRTARQFPA